MIRTIWGSIVMIAVWAVAGSVPTAHAQESLEREYEIKAAFLYNFVKFVEWPAEALPEANPTLNICVLGVDPFGTALESLRNKTVKGKSLAIRRLEGVDDLGGCHVLFISSSEVKKVAEIVRALKGSSILTVGDMERFAERGGIINLVVDRNRVRFDINVGSAERARLKISSQLLKLARVLTETP